MLAEVKSFIQHEYEQLLEYNGDLTTKNVHKSQNQ